MHLLKRNPIILGALSAVVIVVTSGMRGWPFSSLTAEPWIFQFNGASNSAFKYSFLALFYLGAAGMCFSWWQLVGLARSGAITAKKVFGVYALWSAILFFATPLFSGDVYVYVADGEVLQRGFNPYEAGVSALGPVPMVHMIHILWRDTLTMYGPIFIRMVQGVAIAAQGNLIAGVMMMRAIAIASVAVAGFSLYKLAQRFDRPATAGLTFALLNPVTMLHLVGGAHNDATMLGLLSAGLAIGFTTKSVWLKGVALFLCAAAGAFKIPGFIGALILGWSWALPASNHLRRSVYASVAGVIALAMFEIQTLVTGLSWGWVKASNVPGLAHPLLSIPNAIALSFGSLVGQGYPFNDLTRPFALLLAGIFSIWIIFRTGANAEHHKLIRAFGWALLAIAWTGPAVYPWYLAWGIALVGAMDTKEMRKPLMIATCTVIFLIAPGGYGILDIPFGTWHIVIAFLTVGVFAYAISHAYRKNRSEEGFAVMRNRTQKMVGLFTK